MANRMNTFNIDIDSIVSRPSDVTATAQWRCLKQTSTGVDIADEGGSVDGVSRYDLVAGAAASMITEGDIPITAASAIDAGAEVCVATGGKVRAKADATAGHKVIGKLTNGTFATADGDEVVVTFYEVGQYAKPA